MKNFSPATQKLLASTCMLIAMAIAICGKGHASLVIASIIGVLISTTVPWKEPVAVKQEENLQDL